jgi:hypothetical protein
MVDFVRLYGEVSPRLDDEHRVVEIGSLIGIYDLHVWKKDGWKAVFQRVRPAEIPGHLGDVRKRETVIASGVVKLDSYVRRADNG